MIFLSKKIAIISVITDTIIVNLSIDHMKYHGKRFMRHFITTINLINLLIRVEFYVCNNFTFSILASLEVGWSVRRTRVFFPEKSHFRVKIFQ